MRQRSVISSCLCLFACSALNRRTIVFYVVVWRCGNEVVKCGCKAIKVHNGIHMSQKKKKTRQCESNVSVENAWGEIYVFTPIYYSTSCRLCALKYTQFRQMFAQLTFRRNRMNSSSRWKMNFGASKELELIQGEWGDRCRSWMKNQILLLNSFMGHRIMSYYMSVSTNGIGEILYFNLI